MSAQERYARLAREPMVEVAGNANPVRSLREILHRRDLLGLLVRRDLKARYKDSALGVVWTLVRPLTQLLIYYIVIGKFLGAERGIPEFAIYVFTGLTAYGLLSEIVSGGTSSIVANSGLVKKVYLPREIFPLASVGSALFNFGIQLVILIAATLVLQSPPITPDLVYFLPSLLVLVSLGTALGLLLAATNVYLRDLQYLVEVVLMVLLWASPIVYSWGMARDALGEGLALDIYTNNPVTLAVLGFQKAFWTAGDGVVPYPDGLMLRLLIASAIGIVLIVVFQRVFARLQGNFAQEL
ncbi:transport permease protein [Agromyces rhizosphaerae]|uniref:Transport permease protein n=1 Tax=Agromyces rhizosphaerae TaxID=88374 RepID=A0A9W6FQ09_9MICO|nr:ABC transporter permease [Agromyces rhizosphaerae]GLI26087.1 transport permease protein [Agromyces rhizosphaerae]